MWSESSDDAVLAALGERLARQRLDRNLTQAAVAREAGVSRATVQRLERGESTQLANLVRVLRALGLLDALERAVPESPPSPVRQALDRGKVRQRASGRLPAAGTGPWRWDDD